ncbi:MAG TPA: hypothetical protein VGM39_05940 [Kofleriaceae bacterium]|jgi:hypothetical protein
MLDRNWEVYDGDTLVVSVSSKPGAILSTGPLAAGQSARQCAFMSARAHSAEHEHQLNQFLEASGSVDEFLAQLRSAGLTVNAA